MMLFLKYIKYRYKVILLFVIFASLFIVSFSLYGIPTKAAAYPALLCLAVFVVVGIVDFFSIRHRHIEFEKIKMDTDDLEPSLPAARSEGEEDLSEIVQIMNERYNEAKETFGKKYDDTVAYYTMWAHQIKTPISSMHLRLKREDNETARVLMSDLVKIEQYVEMVMTYLRLDSQSTDYVFRECDLGEIVKAAVKQFSGDFISKGIELDFDISDTSVVTDEKWLAFVVSQVISNALKYTDTGKISIYIEDRCTLCVKDTGCGIASEDLPRIFEPGFTGENGRLGKKSSGIGLYLCRRICDNLGHTISVESKQGEGTIVKVDLNNYSGYDS